MSDLNQPNTQFYHVFYIYNYLFVSKNKKEIQELNTYINQEFSDDIISIEISY